MYLHSDTRHCTVLLVLCTLLTGNDGCIDSISIPASILYMLCVVTKLKAIRKKRNENKIYCSI